MSNHAGKAFGVADMTDVLLDCWFRLLSLSSHPHDIPVLAPLYEKELLYLTLQGPLGAALRDIAMQGSALKRVHLAVSDYGCISRRVFRSNNWLKFRG
ncbi:MAG TPA: AraC family transcriptional regulator [Psychromonas sp.]